MRTGVQSQLMSKALSNLWQGAVRRARAIRPIERTNQTISSPRNERTLGGPVHISVAIREAMEYLSRARERRNLRPKRQLTASW
jgi:hypothetical protein